MARSGAEDQAISILQPLYEKDPNNAETAGILAGIYKSRFKDTGDPVFAERSLKIYLQNYQSTSSYYTGINAATIHKFLGNDDSAKTIAGEIIQQLTSGKEDMWEEATLGEAYLLIGDDQNAENHYAIAAKLGKGQHGQINSIYSQLLFLSEKIKVPQTILDLFEPPKIAVFTGHMIDHPNRHQERFPERITEQVKTALKETIDEDRIRIGYSSLACGGDLLFVEALLESGGEANVFLPFAREDFVAASVSFAGTDWVSRFERIIESTEIKFITEEKHFGDDEIYDFLNKVLVGSAGLRAAQLHSEPVLLTVLSGSEQQEKIGGSKSFHSAWKDTGNKIINVDPDQFTKRPKAVSSGKPSLPRVVEREADNVNRMIRYILFADIVGYSKLEEAQMPFFIHHLLAGMSKQLDDLRRPHILNTWGDSIFAIFEEAGTTVEYATRLLGTFDRVDRFREQLPRDLSLRIALHAGPIFVGEDPLTGKMNAYGAHVNRAARMEPVTLPGTIYASQQFAAALAVEAYDHYKFQYVGMVSLAKDYGVQEVYMIRKK